MGCECSAPIQREDASFMPSVGEMAIVFESLSNQGYRIVNQNNSNGRNIHPTINENEVTNSQNLPDIIESNTINALNPEANENNNTTNLHNQQGIVERNTANTQNTPNVVENNNINTPNTQENNPIYAQNAQTVVENNPNNAQNTPAIAENNTANLQNTQTVVENNPINAQNTSAIAENNTANLQNTQTVVENNPINAQNTPTIAENNTANLQNTQTVVENNPNNAQNTPAIAENNTENLQNTQTIVENNPINAQNTPTIAENNTENLQNTQTVVENNPNNAQNTPTIAENNIANLQNTQTVVENNPINAQNTPTIAENNIANLQNTQTVVDNNPNNAQNTPTIAENNTANLQNTQTVVENNPINAQNQTVDENLHMMLNRINQFYETPQQNNNPLGIPIPVQEGQLRTSLHCHPVTSSNRKFICDICLKLYDTETNHYMCQQCDFDICQSCYDGNSQSPLLPIKAALYSTYLNYEECQEIINLINQRNDIILEIPSLTHIISISRPSFYLFEEQKKEVNNDLYKLVATRKYVDANGNNILYFSSHQASKIIRTCRFAVNRFLNNHSFRLYLNKYYDYLCRINREEHNFQQYITDFLKGGAYGYLYVQTFGIAYLAERFFLSPIFEEAVASVFFRNFLSACAANSLIGCETVLTNDEHIYPCFDHPSTKIFPDHNLKIDWSTIESIPYILSLIKTMKRLYPNYKMNHDNLGLNILFGAADYLEDGLIQMKNDHSFSCPFYQKLISFTFNSLETLQISMRFTREPLTIFRTTVLNVYQARYTNEKTSHAFLSQNELQNMLIHLIPDIRESLTALNNGTILELDVNNCQVVLNFVNQFIERAEAQLAKFINDMTNYIYGISRILTLAFVRTLNSEYRQIAELVDIILARPSPHINQTQNNQLQNNQAQNNQLQNNQAQNNQLQNNQTQNNQLQNNQDQNNQLQNNQAQNNEIQVNPAIKLFIQEHVDQIQSHIVNGIRNHVVPDLYSQSIAIYKGNIARFNHLKQIILLACEITRRRNDDNNAFHIDFEIENCDECVRKYHIHLIV